MPNFFDLNMKPFQMPEKALLDALDRAKPSPLMHYRGSVFPQGSLGVRDEDVMAPSVRKKLKLKDLF